MLKYFYLNFFAQIFYSNFCCSNIFLLNNFLLKYFFTRIFLLLKVIFSCKFYFTILTKIFALILNEIFFTAHLEFFLLSVYFLYCSLYGSFLHFELQFRGQITVITRVLRRLTRFVRVIGCLSGFKMPPISDKCRPCVGIWNLNPQATRLLLIKVIALGFLKKYRLGNG